MSSIIGLDLSLTQSGVAVLRDGRLAYSRAINPKRGGVQRLLEIEGAVNQVLALEEEHDLRLVVLEGYAFARGHQSHQMGELGGVVRRMLYVRGTPWVEVAPSAVKKFCTGKGNAQKDLILQQVLKRWGMEFRTSDEADAFVLAKIGQALLGDRAGLTAFQTEVVRELEKKGQKKLREVG